MSVRAAATGGHAGKIITAVLGLALTAATVSGCGQGGPGASAGGRAGPAKAALTATVVLDAGGHAWQPTASGAVLVSTDAGRSWATVRLPGPAADGHSVVVSGPAIAAVTVTARGLAYQRSTNGGASWRAIAIPVSTPTNQASIAVSGNGREVAVMALLPNSAGADVLPELAVGPVAGPLRAVSAPAGGYVAWAGSTLVITGGALQSRLYTSANTGASWTARPVAGPVAPRFNVSPDTPGFGAPMPGAGSAVTVPVTEHSGGGSFVQLYQSRNGLGYTAGPRVALTGVVGPGVTALASPAGPGRYVIATPGSTRLQFAGGGPARTVRPSGMTGAIESLTFSDARNGLAETVQNSCHGKEHCQATTALYRTSDGGHTWELVSP